MTQGIATERLNLRLLRAADAGWIATEISQPEVHQWLTSPPYPYRLEHAHAFLADVAGAPFFRAIERDGDPLGVISIGTSNNDEPDLGYWINRSSCQFDVVSHFVYIAAVSAEIDLHVDNNQRGILCGKISIVWPSIRL